MKAKILRVEKRTKVIRRHKLVANLAINRHTCDYCGMIFLRWPSNYRKTHNYCSKKCFFSNCIGKPGRKQEKAGNWRGGKQETICKECGKKFLVFPCYIKAGKNYCSKKCQGMARSKLYVREASTNWKGGTKRCNGYILDLAQSQSPTNKSTYVPRHRLVMEQHLGRRLSAAEIVHHINGNASDNCLGNLKLFPNQSQHMISHREQERKLCAQKS